LTETFIWDGFDRFGRPVNGGARALVTVDYFYEGFYATPAQLANAFALYGGDTTNVGTRGIFKKSASFETTLGTWREDLQGLGGWSLTVHHAYDPVATKLYLGDGRRRSNIGVTIHTVGGGSSPPFNMNEGGPAIGAWINPWGLEVGPDGSIYFVDSSNCIVRRIDPNGIITTVAGILSTPGLPICGFTGDSGPATQARLNVPRSVAIGPDSSLYIADSGNRRIRRVDPSGVITTFAGNGQTAISGDGGLATQAGLGVEVRDVAVGPDSSVYIAGHANNGRVRRVAPDGLITTVAGGGGSTSPPPGSPGTALFIDQLSAVALGPDGSVFFTQDSSFSSRRAWKVDLQGTLSRIAGVPGGSGVSGDGGPALDAQLSSLNDIAVAPDGTIYLECQVTSEVSAPPTTSGVRVITPDGIIHKLVGRFDLEGSQGQGFVGEGGPAAAAFVVVTRGVALGPPGIGGLYLSDSTGRRIYHIRPPLPGFSASQILIPSEDGSEAYIFLQCCRQAPRDPPCAPRHASLSVRL
jgi:sugar lactone lactonase YvrE